MIVSFGEGKCPLCGNFGKTTGHKTFKCNRCEISFNNFLISAAREIEEYTDIYWS
ncbi:hypothetical protein HYZ41_01820 [archaeon]|nr:hypothetical protein [archaeon]